jgi:hypothetical protein
MQRLYMMEGGYGKVGGGEYYVLRIKYYVLW